ncbi:MULTISPECIES: hypothetical protein [Desulfofundulus]|jgi:hypothetical protein|uniref:Uncharacterized protein n=1 Tax=Desulfofundulus australicus DSM 11792 TaxID=1121425 RepID=A0A1M4ZLL2_9FIRM|nr:MULTISPECIES: hypothetical protein [Desulfofundulus]MCS5695748.1 hypothetical protein [Desulfofundulus thermocisternus]MDK2887238.1 hypothetical protein [Thermoanaerobacter sp.]SHF18949.1 hypothetical protein SAMN02745218_01650 [Desulfofundulus australicus DSM 11792]
MFDWSIFYAGMAIVLGIGVLAAIFAGPVEQVMEKVEEKASGRTH